MALKCPSRLHPFHQATPSSISQIVATLNNELGYSAISYLYIVNISVLITSQVKNKNHSY